MNILSFYTRRHFTSRLLQVPLRGLYFKDKELDKKNYKPSEQDQLEAYLKNHLQDDPKPLSEQDKAKLYEQFYQLQAESKQETKAFPQESTRKLNVQQPSSDLPQSAAGAPPVIDATVLKDMFDKMTEIDSDPDSKRAQDYYKKLEEMERKNPNKKKSQIIIKTMKRGRTVKQETFQDGSFIGKQITEEERVFQRKYIDYRAVQFPEINPIDFRVKGQGKELKIANYRFPSTQADRKGIIFFNNGYGDYCARYAFFAELFAKAGYDFVCMDGRGFGHSEGKRAFIESENSISEDTIKFQDMVIDKFGDKNTPKLMLGVSMGGLVSAKLSLIRPNFYNGMGLVVPYMKLLNQDIIDSKMGLIKFIDKFAPSFRVPIPLSQKKAILNTKHLQTINRDPLLEVEKIPVRNLVVNEASLRQFQQKESEKVTTPFLMILSGRDQVVDNRGSKDFFEIQSSKVKDKDLITYEDADHFLLLDNEYMPLVAKDLIGWFNTHV